MAYKSNRNHDYYQVSASFEPGACFKNGWYQNAIDTMILLRLQLISSPGGLFHNGLKKSSETNSFIRFGLILNHPKINKLNPKDISAIEIVIFTGCPGIFSIPKGCRGLSRLVGGVVHGTKVVGTFCDKT